MIEIQHLSKTFAGADGDVEALRDINLKINDGDIFGIIGMSGAGKSTLVRCINMLERPTSGTVLINGRDIGALSAEELRKVRRRTTMIFQSFNLLMQRTCLANICFPLELAGMKKAEAKKRAGELLELVGLSDKANAYPAQLSGGQQQRIAIARALATDPEVLLCDEATSALDPKTTRSILELIKQINEQLGITVIIITHQMNVIEDICTRVAILENGTVVEEGEVSKVFSNPASDAGKNIVSPEERALLESDIDERIIRLVFNGSAAAGRPVIAQMALDEGISANILYASTRFIGDKVFGRMLLGLPGDNDDAERALAYLRRSGDIFAEEVERNV
ncbi:MAG: methionine ABC transporter ATP-binding protein [Oscillospiraceae bacterium]